MKTIDISQKHKRDHQTVKRFVSDSEHRWVCADKGIRRKVSARQIHRIKRAGGKMPLQSSKQVFEAAGAFGVPQISRCKPTITNLGVEIDPDLKLDRQIRSVVKTSFFSFEAIGQSKAISV